MQQSECPGLYVHVPFCRSKCPYCAFFSIASPTLISRWVEALKKEILLYKNESGRFDTLYFGGGTPTLLGTEIMDDIMEHIFSHFSIAPKAEITIEANPCDLTPDKIGALQAMGFNRVSLGVQSFDDRILGFLGRRHTVSQAETAILALRSAGFENIGLDLIYGFCQQPETEWIKTLRRAVSFLPEHLSCYQITIEGKTVFKRMLDDGLLKPLGDNEESSFFKTTSDFLEENGYIHYEISSFSRSKAFFSEHNQKYWRHIPYLGLGPSAHSFSKSRRWWNVRSVKSYCEALEQGRAPVEDVERLSQEELRFESIFLGLRTKDGFSQSNVSPQTLAMLPRFLESGHVRLHNERIAPTQKGFMVADYLACRLSE